MKKELSNDVFVPYKICVNSIEDHDILCKIVSIAIDAYTVRDLPISDFEYVKYIVEGPLK